MNLFEKPSPLFSQLVFYSDRKSEDFDFEGDEFE